MSKKSRRRNRRLLTALAALGGAAMLAGRGRGTTGANVDSGRGSGLRPTVDDKPKKVFQDAIMRGGKGVKAAKVGGFPRLKVTDRGDVIRDGVNTGVGNKKTKFVGGDGKIFQGGVQVGEAGKTSPGISVRKDGSIMAKGVLYPNRSAYMNRNKMPGNLSRDMGMGRGVVRTPVNILQGVPEDALMAKDGGKIVKGEKKAVRPKKKTRIQIQGFGKARR